MQSAHSEVHQTASSIDNVSTPASSSQHGLLFTDEQASDGFSSTGVVRVSSNVEDDTDNASIGSSYTHRGRRLDGRRLSRAASSSDGSSHTSRIDEYERAHGIPRKSLDGMLFQVIPTAAGKQPTVNMLDLPNEVLTHVISNLPPETLSMMSLVSKRFHKLVTTPHAWRIAFAGYFPAPDSSIVSAQRSPTTDVPKSERRFFTRLSALASWRSEYILRTRLLRSLARGRPAIQPSSKSASRHGTVPAAAVVTYGSGLIYPVSHVHATFGIGLNKKQPLFIHGASEQGAVSTSDPAVSKIGSWGLGDFENFKHFEDLFIGESEYGLGLGQVVGMPNVMDVSQPYGKIYGEACPGGRVFFTSTSEQRGRFLPITSTANHELGIPEVNMLGCAITSVWIAKSEGVLKMTNGVFGCLAGFSNGVLAAYALGVNPVHDRRYAHGELTAKWVLCPGVPIIAIAVDEHINARRLGHRKIWAAVLNALGEVFYLLDTPTRPEFKGKASAIDTDRLAWQTGRSIDWHLIESTRREAVPDPFNVATIDGSYTLRSSSDAQGLSTPQIVAETKEIEKFLGHKPRHCRAICQGWDMRRKLLVDFPGDRFDGSEAVFVVSCGLDDGQTSSIKRFSRRKIKLAVDVGAEEYPSITSTLQAASVFGRSSQLLSELGSPSPRSTPRSRTSSNEDINDDLFRTEWFASNFTFGHLRGVQVSAVALDESEFASLAVNEDPLLGMSGESHNSSPTSSPFGTGLKHDNTSEIPGHRARFVAVGTMTGMVLLWNMRATISPALDIVNDVQPLRYIYTRSPQISSLALTSLYVVHGGNDGLVQAWDPLGSSAEPIRTLNSRFSDRARRRIAQAEASIHGVGKNYYAAGAIVLDPDPTVLRGMVSLGTHLRYWSYSAGAADAYKSRKRGQLSRRAERGSNSATNEPKFHHTGRGVLKDYIQHEKQDLEFEKVVKRKEKERISGRFGVDLLGEGASEEEMLAYATMLSEEAFAEEATKFSSSPPAAPMSSSKWSKTTPPVEPVDDDLEEAIRLSLLDSELAAESPQTTDFNVPIRYAKGSKRSTPFRQYESSRARDTVSPSGDEDLEFALQLSLAEQQSRMVDEDEFPTLSPSAGPESGIKGKGKIRRS